MKISFISNPRLSTSQYEIFKTIHQQIISMGHEHSNNFIEDIDIHFEKKMIKNKNAQKEFVKKIIKSISLSDICIFEATQPSFGIGYLIEKSLSMAKPTIILFYKKNTSLVLPNIEDEKLITKVYTEKTLTKVLKQSLLIAKQRRDKRFNFYLSTKLLEYVDNLSKEEGVTKSKIMRDIILRDMRNKLD